MTAKRISADAFSASPFAGWVADTMICLNGYDGAGTRAGVVADEELDFVGNYDIKFWMRREIESLSR